jgi:hypothetical protein
MVIYPKVKNVRCHTTLQKSFMLLPGIPRSLSFVGLASLSALALMVFRAPATQAQAVQTQPAQAQPAQVQPAQAQTPQPEVQPAPAEPSADPNSDLRPLSDGSLFSVEGGQRLMQEASSAVSSQNYAVAVQKLQEARQIFNQLSNFYQELAASFSGIDTRIADSQRQQAISTAQMRDEATFQLALVHRAQNKPELSVPLLVQIIRSQNPTRELGQKAYQQLYELGFVDSPYPRAQDGSTSATPR